MNTDFLRQTVISLVQDDQTVPVSEQGVIEAMGKELSETISLPLDYEFCYRYNVTNCIRTGIKSLSPAKIEINSKCLSNHLGRLKR